MGRVNLQLDPFEITPKDNPLLFPSADVDLDHLDHNGIVVPTNIQELSMKTLSIDTKKIAGPAVTRRWAVQRGLLACGVVSSLYYVITLWLGAMRWEGYDATSQAISAL